MFIKKIEVKNFKSFRELSITPSKFNVLIGPNASGKTNFLQIFKFIRDIVNFGLQEAISLQGGVDYLRNIRIGKEGKQTQFRLEFEYNKFASGVKKINDKLIKIKPIKLITDFTIRYTETLDGYCVEDDNLIQEFIFCELSDDGLEEAELGSGTLEFHNVNGDVNSNFYFENNLNISIDDIVPIFFTDKDDIFIQYNKHLFLENSYYMPYPCNIHKVLSELPIYDLDPLQGPAISLISGRSQLTENGENIAIVLRRILSNTETSRQFFNYIKHVLPFVEDIAVERLLDKHLQIKVREQYAPNEFLPASLMSNGSVTLISIIIALFFENKKISIFEEPGGRVHPYLISKIIDMMKDASESMQIFLTTHNPEIVKYAGLSNIFYLLRDKDGYSVISHISNKEEIAEFMKNEIGLEELFVQNLLSK